MGQEQSGVPAYRNIKEEDEEAAAPRTQPTVQPAPEKLGELEATAVAGNDVLSSCLYTVGICAVAAGVYAPIATLLVVMMLHFFRAIYGEIGSAIPHNGGAYNVLLVTAPRGMALFAATLTLVSYIATGVVSATSAAHHLANLWSGSNVLALAVFLLFFFAFLNYLGITESAFVASVIFVLHILTLTVLLGFSFAQFVRTGTKILEDNAASPLQPSVVQSLFYGFSAATLGITGFETSSNYIEEQAPGVFPKTLRNMWLVALIFNPALSFLAVGILPMADIKAHTEIVLSKMALASAGSWLEVWVSIDAFFVLSGSLITAYVGVTGLVRRLSQDECMPSFLLIRNAWRNTNHWIIISFFIVCFSLVVATNAHVDDMAGVYSIAFVSVMALFAVGDILLKLNLDKEFANRAIRAYWFEVIAALVLVLLALVITIIRGPNFLLIFTIYVVAVGGAVTVTVALSGRDPPSSSNPATASSDSSQPDDALPVDAASKST